jgi:hypothetical protein
VDLWKSSFIVAVEGIVFLPTLWKILWKKQGICGKPMTAKRFPDFHKPRFETPV